MRIALSLAMAVYMYVRRHGWRHNLVMSGGTLAVGVVLIGAVSAGVLPGSSLPDRASTFVIVCGPACLVMLVIVLLDFDMYSGRADRATQHGPAPSN